jgi:hypothetical protein
MTRPEPTIYGNCDSWDLIVGRTRWPHRLKPWRCGSLRVKITAFIHRLFTISKWLFRDNLWASCGSICTSRQLASDAPKTTIYIAEEEVLACTLDQNTADSSLIVSVRTHQKYFQKTLEESIKLRLQGLTLGIPWFSTGANQNILRPFAAAKQDIDRF